MAVHIELLQSTAQKVETGAHFSYFCMRSSSDIHLLQTYLVPFLLGPAVHLSLK